jgi:ATP-dependent DNA ligase
LSNVVRPKLATSRTHELRPLPLSERKARLSKLLARAPVGIVFNEHADEDGGGRPRQA